MNNKKLKIILLVGGIIFLVTQAMADVLRPLAAYERHGGSPVAAADLLHLASQYKALEFKSSWRGINEFTDAAGTRFVNVEAGSRSDDIEIPVGGRVVLGSKGYNYCISGILCWEQDGKMFINHEHSIPAWWSFKRSLKSKIARLAGKGARNIKLFLHSNSASFMAELNFISPVKQSESVDEIKEYFGNAVAVEVASKESVIDVTGKEVSPSTTVIGAREGVAVLYEDHLAHLNRAVAWDSFKPCELPAGAHSVGGRSAVEEAVLRPLAIGESNRVVLLHESGADRGAEAYAVPQELTSLYRELDRRFRASGFIPHYDLSRDHGRVSGADGVLYMNVQASSDSGDVPISEGGRVVLGSVDKYDFCTSTAVTWERNGKKYLWMQHALPGWWHVMGDLIRKVRGLQQAEAHTIKIILCPHAKTIGTESDMGPSYADPEALAWHAYEALRSSKDITIDSIGISVSLRREVVLEDGSELHSPATVLASTEGVGIFYDDKRASPDQVYRWSDVHPIAGSRISTMGRAGSVSDVLRPLALDERPAGEVNSKLLGGPVTIAHASFGDIKEIGDLFEREYLKDIEVSARPQTAEEAARKIADFHDDVQEIMRSQGEKGIIIAAYAHNRVVGWLRLFIDNDGTGWLGPLFVRDAFRGRRIGPGLCVEAVRWAEDNMRVRVIKSVDNSEGHKTTKILKEIGFVREGYLTLDLEAKRAERNRLVLANSSAYVQRPKARFMRTIKLLGARVLNTLSGGLSRKVLEQI
ncbi:MAG: GNAT family N-acetyltransferase [Candidatus Omnitrophota bacterium]